MLGYARDYRLIEFVCKRFDWICRQVFLVETKYHLDMAAVSASEAGPSVASGNNLLIVNEQITDGSVRKKTGARVAEWETAHTFWITMPAS